MTRGHAHDPLHMVVLAGLELPEALRGGHILYSTQPLPIHLPGGKSLREAIPKGAAGLVAQVAGVGVRLRRGEFESPDELCRSGGQERSNHWIFAWAIARHQVGERALKDVAHRQPLAKVDVSQRIHMHSPGIIQSLMRALPELAPWTLGHLGGEPRGGATAEQDRTSGDGLAGGRDEGSRHALGYLADDRIGRDA